MQAGVSGKVAAVPQANQRRWGATYPNQIRILFIRYVCASDAQHQLAGLAAQRFMSPTLSQVLSCPVIFWLCCFPKGDFGLYRVCKLQEPS